MSCSSGIGSSNSNQGCVDQYGCNGACPDFTIRRNDNKPSFRVKIEDCDGPMDLTDLVVESAMWAKGKLKTAITADDTYFAFADNIGFNQIMIGDIIIMERARMPEKMLVTAFDEDNRLVQVQRAYHGTTAQKWKKGTPLRIMKFFGATASSEMLYQDILEIDGTTTVNVLTESFFVYEWGANDTCLPGCYFFEFKLLKMTEVTEMGFVQSMSTPSVIPSFTPSNLSVTDFNCGLPAGIEWIRKFPSDVEGFLVKIFDAPNTEI